MQIELDPGFAEPPLGYVPPPPADSRDRLDRLRLLRSRRVGPVTFQRLLSDHGSAEAALKALPGIALKAGVDKYAVCPEGTALAEMKAAKRAGAQMLCLGDAAYPATLAGIRDAPPVLWALGNTGFAHRPVLAIVGTRNASSLGARMARRLAGDLGQAGYVVVSGLARGIDTLAHAASLETGTIGIHAGGLDVMYPVENTKLAEDMARRGLRLSEQPFGLDPQARHFPRRNRIVAGLARAVIVVEAAGRSGSLITARIALDQGREVLAIPGHPMDTRASGCNMLIRDGATLIRGADDVLDQIGMPDAQADLPLPTPIVRPPATNPPRPERDSLTRRILTRLGPSPTAENQLIRDLGLPAPQITRVLAQMELAGSIERRPGGFLTRAAV
ncbi:DNA-protecting protein DprA [Rhodophyticola sp. CCM32]|uniref:DNA-processing protein DprA n=1 Tax=Rhodophyticola sp. CCM32 TaxID=2916397 RepID=UPI00107FA011|nr:DNA-processing protein DprA [Rhodophyticola sp. CCM32]QBY02504.1 DNA-protecting protein DprA [Rhodophyticola sp. CCM32]